MILLALALLAADPDCDSNALTQAEMNECAGKHFAEADARLNAQWKRTFQTFQRLSPEDADRLRTAQRAWIAFRDAECDAEYPADSGTLDRMMNIDCRTEMTDERTQQLDLIEQANR